MHPLVPLTPWYAVPPYSADEYSNALWDQASSHVGLLTLVVHIKLHDGCSESLFLVFVQLQVNHQILEIVVVQPR